MSKLLDYFRLMRVSNVLTAVSNILMGFLLASGSWRPSWALAILVLASVCMYLSGMVFNDLFDLPVDRQQRPERPLPSGRIPIRHASYLGIGLLVSGMSLAWLLTWLNPEPARGHYPGRTGLVALSLAICILAYDLGGKNSRYGPVLMGGCRLLNVLLGCSICVLNVKHVFLGFEPIQWFIAMGVGTYVAGITWFAKYENQINPSRYLFFSSLVMGAGIVILVCQIPALSARLTDFVEPITMSASDFAIGGTLWAMLMLPVLLRIVSAIRRPEARLIQQAVVVSLLSLIMIDAAICYFVAMDRPIFGLVVASLIIPTYWLGRLINPT